MSDSRRPEPTMACSEADELAGLYVLDALDEHDRALVASHLAECPNAHEQFAELGGVVPALALLAEPVDAPADLRARVLAAYAQEAPQPIPALPADLRMTRMSAPVEARRTAAAPRAWQLPAWGSWVTAAAAALLVVALVGAWGLAARADADRAVARTQEVERAIAALSDPGSSVAILRGSGPAAGASGFAAFPAEGGGYVVLVDLPSAPAGQTYQAWYIAGDTPASAGLLSVGSDGYAVLAQAQPVAGTQVVALTLEPAGGSVAPTSDPIVVGQVEAPA
jgi:hypothetical protein